MRHLDTEVFIREYQQKLRNILAENPEIETVNHLRGLPRHFLNMILAPEPLSIFIPSEYGGRGRGVHHRNRGVGACLAKVGGRALPRLPRYSHLE